LWQPVVRARKLAISVAVAFVLALGGSILLPGIFDLISPPPAMATPCTLSILSGEVEFGKAGADSWQPGTDGMTLTVGTHVRTAADGHAVLTFFEGSTIKLHPGAVVGIREVGHSDEEPVAIVLEQLSGSTWSHVEKADPAAYYKIQTPSATVTALGTLFATHVDDTGGTKVAATQGSVSVLAQGREVCLTASYQTEVKAGAIPSTPQKVSSAKAELLIVADMPAVCSVRDPTGSSTGYLPSGLSFNQITGSESSMLSSGPQVISIAQPVSGEYAFVLRYIAQETARFSIRSQSEGAVVFEHTGELASVEGGGWLVRINLNVHGDVLVSGAVVAIEPLGDVGPEKLVTTDLARQRAVPIKPSTADNDAQDGPTDGQGDDNDVSGNVDDKDSYDGVRDGDSGGDISDNNKNDSTARGDTDDEAGYDNADGDTSDAEPSDNVGVERSSSNLQTVR
jgi:hypothetical protein